MPAFKSAQVVGCWHLALLLSAFFLPSVAVDLPPLIPAVHLFTPESDAASSFHLSSAVHIVVDAKDAQATEDSGLTLIPPTLFAFAQTFKADIQTLFPQTRVTLAVGDTQGSSDTRNFITISLSDHLNATYADGAATTEGYEMDVSNLGIRIVASGGRGAFWATRTLLQGLVLSGGQFPPGKIVDQPDWRTRGFMLGWSLDLLVIWKRTEIFPLPDVGRQWYPITFLRELCTYASWFKVSEFVSAERAAVADKSHAPVSRPQIRAADRLGA